MNEQRGGTGRYLFAVSRGLSPDALDGVPGLAGHPVEALRCGDLQAVVCTVDLAEFGEQELARNLEDLDWLEKVARAHNEVVFAAAFVGTVAPMRLVTICSDDASVRARVEELHDELVAALDRVEGRREWSVKAYAAAPVTTPETDAISPQAAQTGAGAAYLQRKKQQAELRRSVDTQFAQLSDEVHHQLSEVAVASRRLPSQDPRLTGRREAMLLNGAYLVGVDDGPQFRDLVMRLGETRREITLEVEGPWPPYSFATLE